MNSKERYKNYLKSDHWKNLNESKRSKSKNRCAICGFTGATDNHHLNYRDWYSVTTSDLRLICRRCHTISHKLTDSGEIKFSSESQHHRFAKTKMAVAKELGVNMCHPNFGDPIKWKHSECLDYF